MRRETNGWLCVVYNVTDTSYLILSINGCRFCIYSLMLSLFTKVFCICKGKYCLLTLFLLCWWVGEDGFSIFSHLIRDREPFNVFFPAIGNPPVTLLALCSSLFLFLYYLIDWITLVLLSQEYKCFLLVTEYLLPVHTVCGIFHLPSLCTLIVFLYISESLNDIIH